MANGVILGQTLNMDGLLPRDGSRPMTGALNMDSHKITNLSNGTANNDAVNYYQLMNSTVSASRISGTLSTSNIPNLSASKITSGTLSTARIPSLDASKITSGQFNTARIPNLSASKITSGVLSVANGGTGVSSLDALLTGLGVHNYAYGDATDEILNLPFKPCLLILSGETAIRQGTATFYSNGFLIAARSASSNIISTCFHSPLGDWEATVTFGNNSVTLSDYRSVDGSYFVF